MGKKRNKSPVKKNIWDAFDYPKTYEDGLSLEDYAQTRRIILRANYPDIDDEELKVLEVISRYRGEAGLSERAVHYLTSAILYHVLGYNNPEPPFNENHYRFHTPNQPGFECPNCRWIGWSE